MTANTEVSNNQRAASTMKENDFIMKEIPSNWNKFEVGIPLWYASFVQYAMKGKSGSFDGNSGEPNSSALG